MPGGRREELTESGRVPDTIQKAKVSHGPELNARLIVHCNIVRSIFDMQEYRTRALGVK
jgi:hypothetical protein